MLILQTISQDGERVEPGAPQGREKCISYDKDQVMITETPRGEEGLIILKSLVWYLLLILESYDVSSSTSTYYLLHNTNSARVTSVSKYCHYWY